MHENTDEITEDDPTESVVDEEVINHEPHSRIT